MISGRVVVVVVVVVCIGLFDVGKMGDVYEMSEERERAKERK